jgi:hypothetical protein
VFSSQYSNTKINFIFLLNCLKLQDIIHGVHNWIGGLPKNTLAQCRILFIYECIMWLFIMQHLVQFTYDGWSHLLVTCHALSEVVTPLALFNCARLHKPFYTYLFNYPFHGIHMHLPSPLSFQLNVFNNPTPLYFFTGFKVWPWNF